MAEREPTRTTEEIRGEQSKIREAVAEISTRISELDESIASASLAEEEAREASMRKGHPAKPNKKLRELRADRADLLEQLKTSERLNAQLTVEYLEAQMEEARVERAAARRKSDRIEEEYRAVEARLNAARTEANGALDRERALREEARRARDTLAALDPHHAERSQQEYEQRLAEIQEGQRRQIEEHNKRVDAEVEEARRTGKTSFIRSA